MKGKKTMKSRKRRQFKNVKEKIENTHTKIKDMKEKETPRKEAAKQKIPEYIQYPPLIPTSFFQGNRSANLRFPEWLHALRRRHWPGDLRQHHPGRVRLPGGPVRRRLRTSQRLHLWPSCQKTEVGLIPFLLINPQFFFSSLVLTHFFLLFWLYWFFFLHIFSVFWFFIIIIDFFFAKILIYLLLWSGMEKNEGHYEISSFKLLYFYLKESWGYWTENWN